MRPRPVKKLKWKVEPALHGLTIYTALSIGARYEEYRISDRGFVRWEPPQFWATLRDEEEYIIEEIGEGSDVRHLKSLCQKHFQKRILSCLTPAARRKLNA